MKAYSHYVIEANIDDYYKKHPNWPPKSPKSEFNKFSTETDTGKTTKASENTKKFKDRSK
ncbi:MAG: hypothetical protein CVU00_02415 [Bacteroidetes bacterium HGW-Bacteroidetes-17]|nr:MAG: hypothetical protein CVU00_02415 [Bacteroidetes bacterium HGW-Bacteroidetes-17]